MTELEKLRQALNPQQLQFVDEYISSYAKLSTGEVYVSDIYAKAFPSSKDSDGCRTSAWRLLNSTAPVRDYVKMVMDESGRTAVKSQIADLNELKEYMTKNMRGIDELFNDILCTRMYNVSKEGESEVYVKGLFVDDMDDVPEPMLKYVESMKHVKGSGWLVKTKMSQADKDRNKCAEMLTKMQGGFIDKVEMSGPNGGAINVTLSGEVKLEVKNILANL